MTTQLAFNYQARHTPALYQKLKSTNNLIVSTDELGQTFGLLTLPQCNALIKSAVHAWLPNVEVTFIGLRGIPDIRFVPRPLRATNDLRFATTVIYDKGHRTPYADIQLDSWKTRWDLLNRDSVFRSLFRKTTTNLFLAVLHELGHALLAIDHVNDPSSVMFRRTTEWQQQERIFTENFTVLPLNDSRALSAYLPTL